MNKKKKILAVMITIAVICGAVVGVSAAVRSTTSGGKVMVVPAEELNYGYGYWEGESMEGYVTSERTQNVRLNTSQSVAEVKVEEGQEVKKGDVLMLYDMKQTEVNLEKAELSLETKKLSLKNAEELLKKLKNTTPSSGDGDDMDEPDEEEDDDADDPEKTVKKPKAADKLTGSSKPYYDAESEAAPGTETNPYRFLVKSGATVNADFINMVKKLQGEQPVCYFVLELRENDSWEGKLIRSWMQNASDVLSPDKEWVGIIDPDSEKPIIPTRTFAEIEELEKQAEENQKKIEKLEKELKELQDKLAEAEAAEKEPDTTPAVTPEPTETPEPSETPEPTETPDEIQQEIADKEAQIDALSEENQALQEQIETLQEQNEVLEENAVSSSSVALHSVLPAGRAAAQPVQMTAATAVYQKITPVTGTTALVHGSGSGAEAVLTDFEEVEVDEDMDDEDASDSDSESDEEDDSISYSPDSLSDSEVDGSYTREELAEAIKTQEENITDLRLDIREAELKVKKAKKALEEGSVKAILDGTVTKVEDVETALADGSPFITVSGNSGIAIRGGLPEKFLGTISEGNQISVASWTNGMQYTATISEISPYPDTTGMFEGGGGYNNSYYPFIAIIDDEDAEMEDNDWVQISIDANTLAQDDGFYLMRAFVLEDGNKGYVYKRGEDGLLHRQDVKLGKLSGDSYEILSGLTADDWVAFPYGKTVKEGAQTREGTMDELYNG